MTYDELIATVQSYMDRDDLETEIKGFISSVEAKLNRNFRFGSMTVKTSILSDGTTEWFDFPTGYLSTRLISVNSIPLEYVTPEQIEKVNTNVNSSYWYTIIAQQFKIIPIPADGINVDITYYQKIPALSDTNQTNWVLDDYFDLYYYGVLAEAMLYIKNYEIYQIWDEKFVSAGDQMDTADSNDRWSGSPLMVRAI